MASPDNTKRLQDVGIISREAISLALLSNENAYSGGYSGSGTDASGLITGGQTKHVPTTATVDSDPILVEYHGRAATERCELLLDLPAMPNHTDAGTSLTVQMLVGPAPAALAVATDPAVSFVLVGGVGGTAAVAHRLRLPVADADIYLAFRLTVTGGTLDPTTAGGEVAELLVRIVF